MTVIRRALAALTTTAVLVAGCSVAGVSDPSGAPASAPPVAVPASTPRPVDHGPERVVHGAPPARPEQPAIAVRYDAALLGDHCVDRDVPAPPATDVALTILDRSYALTADYAPTDLVPASTPG